MDDIAKTVYVFLLPLTSSPYMIWVIHKEGQEPAEYFKDPYDNRVGWMWVVRISMMVIASSSSSVAAIFIFGMIALIVRLI
jgi:hypothetical protein